MKSRVIASAVIEHEGRLLFGRKPRGMGPYPDTLHLLGGGVRLCDETAEDALRREVREEAGLDLESAEPIGFDEDSEPDKHGEMTHYIFLIYRARIAGNAQARAGEDIERLEWVAREKLGAALLNKPTIKLFKRVGYL